MKVWKYVRPTPPINNKIDFLSPRPTPLEVYLGNIHIPECVL